MKVNGYDIAPGADLRAADLAGADLTGAILTGADLAGAYRRETDAVIPGWVVVDGRMTWEVA